MKKNIILITLLAVFVLMSCSDKDETATINSIQITTALQVKVEDTNTLKVEVLPQNATEKAELQWSSTDNSIVAVDEEGGITALRSGEATIKVELVRNPAIFSECLITVTEKEGQLAPDAVITFEDPMLAAMILQYDTNNDGQLQYSEALEIRQLLIGSSGIKSLKGIEYLENLVTLSAQGNMLSEADLSANKHLGYLYLYGNILESVTVSNLESLTELNCGANRLKAIDVTTNPNLKVLNISLNHEGRGNNGQGITRLDVSQNKKLKKLDLNYTNVSELDLSNNPELKWIDFGLTSYTSPDTDPITQIDFSNNLKLEHIKCDAMVRTAGLDGSIVKDKVGLSVLDVTMLPQLKYLNFEGNSIKNIDLSKNTKLEQLTCSRNYLKELDITNNTLLERLICERNELTVLDLEKNTSLNYLNCANNKIQKLDISQTSMSYLLGQNNQIEVFSLGDKVFDSVWGNDKKPYLYLNLNDNKISSLDVSKQVNLAWLEINNNELTQLDISNCSYLGGALLNNNKVSKLNVAHISRIWDLQARDNRLSGDLDVSHLNNLGTLYLDGNAGLKNIYVWSTFNKDCSAYVSNHTTGFTGSVKCYTKDDTAAWVKK